MVTAKKIVLKQIEVENFKSYNGKNTIGPFKPFTAVIGPNGSGKSNFMDAISFVMGEKTSKLRVKRLSALIHGAMIGQPVATSASVTAVFTNADREEVKFKRSVLNSASEYRLNEEIITRQEYLNALNGYGINAKAKNFLVFQGSVEEIALMEPIALCSLLEEISASCEFKAEYDRLKAEKLQAEKATQFAFQKKKTVAADKKMAKMEKQEAQKFQRLRKEYVKKSVELQLFRLSSIEKKIAKLENEGEEKRAKLSEIETVKRTEEESLTDHKKEAGRLSRGLAKLEQDLREAELQIATKKPKLIKTKEHVAHLQKKVETTQKLLENARQADEAHKKDIRELEEELARIEMAKNSYEISVEGQSQVTQSPANITLDAQQIQEYNRLKEVASRESARYQQSLDTLTREQKSDQDKLDNVVRKRNDIENKIRQMKRHMQQGEERRRQKLKESIETWEAALADLRVQHAEMQSVVHGSKEKCQQIQQEIEKINTELGDATLNKDEALRERRKAEIVESLREICPGVHDRIINLCKPIHERYHVALTKVLGKNMDAIVVDTEKTAWECIRYLKTALIPPETFLPLNYIQPTPLKERLRCIQNPPNVKLIYDVLKFPKDVEPAVVFVTRNTLVCETAEDANHVAYDWDPNNQYDCVSLDGTYYQKSGIISGGNLELRRRAKRWNDKQMSQLKLQRDKLTEELRELLKKSRRVSELTNIETQLNGLEVRLNYGKADIREATKNLELQNIELSAMQKESRNNLQPAIGAIEAVMAQREQEIQRIKESVNDLEDRIFVDFCEQIGVANIRQYEERGLPAQQERDRKRMDFDNQSNRIATQLEFEKNRDTNSNIERWTKAVEEADAALRTVKEAEIELIAEITEDEIQKDKLAALVNAKKLEVGREEETLARSRETLKTLSKEIMRLQRNISAIEANIERQRADRHAILMKCKMEDIQIPILAGSIEDVGNGESPTGDGDSTQSQYMHEGQIRVDYALLPDDVRDHEEEADVNRIIGDYMKAMSELNADIAKIRAPNNRAEENFTTAADKFHETTEEFENLRQKARKIVVEFEKVKQNRYDRFMAAFEHISTEIDAVYKGLVKNQSAQAYLEVENPEEPYLGGISFNCVAPEKRFQTMSALSGGEKSVAALGLLFAINSRQPSPFFVLDEIDAALDAANLNNVVHYIKERSKSTQMIVISLKLQMYHKANLLVGISPNTGECLKSKVLSLDLDEYLP